MDKIKQEIVRRRWTPPLQGITAVIGYALLTFNVIVSAMYPENIESYAWVNGIVTLIFYSLIHLGSRMYTHGLNALEEEKVLTVLMVLNSIAESDGTFSADDGLIDKQGESND